MKHLDLLVPGMYRVLQICRDYFTVVPDIITKEEKCNDVMLENIFMNEQYVTMICMFCL